jgi:signal transduction histidine kinase
MAKETAHQLGTPISSLMGWQEILKMNFKNPDKVLDVANEMSNDLSRLTKIANRFSKIGSKPKLKPINVYDVICVVKEYFNRRISHTHDSVKITLGGDKHAIAMVNSDLFEWVIENLVKNALDAIGSKKNGSVDLRVISSNETIDIELEDNGKGIELNRRKDVFRPGYSTKKRGWGLGLSLARRIVVNYHKGKLFVKNSVIDEGTTFQISLIKPLKSS